MKRGSALLLALWVILSLSVIVLAFLFEARLQRGVNIYVENKNRVRRLLDAGRIMGEVVILDYKNAQQWTEGEDVEEKLEEDRWFIEKRNLKYSKGCTIGPIQLDDETQNAGTVKVELSLSSVSGINVNTLHKDGDANFEDRWRVILDMCGVPRDESVQDEEGHTLNLQSYIIACWQDYRDEDEAVYTVADQPNFKGSQGAEKQEYEDYYADHEKDFAEEDRFEPANGEISDLKELSRVICFAKFPAVLTGGALNPRKDGGRKDEDEVVIARGLVNLGILSTSGDGKVNVNNCTVEQLMTVPGIIDPDELDENDKSESRQIAEAIVKCRKIRPTEYDVPEEPNRDEWGYGEFTPDWWSDLCQRVSKEFSDLEIPQDAKNYLVARPSETDDSVFTMKITARTLDMEYVVTAECYIKDKKIRYISWTEE